MKRISATAVIVAGLTLALQAASARTPLPDRPPGNALVHDFAGIIGAGAEQQMESINQDLKNKTGVVIVVVTVDKLVDETIEEFGLRIGETWGVGRKGEDRGIVVALSLEPRKITIQTGYGVEGYLPDGRVGQLRDEYALPYLRKNQFSEGLLALDQALVAWSAKEFNVQITGAPPPSRVHRARDRKATTGQIIFGILAIIALIYMGIRHPRALFWILLFMSSGGRGGGGFGGGGFGGGGGFSGFGGGGFGGGGASGDF
jgi:uncharacterized protein